MSATLKTLENWHRIRRLRQRGMSQRTIASRLRIRRETVRWAVNTETPPPPTPLLGVKSRTALRLAAAGHTEHQIASELGVARSTARQYLCQAQARLGVSSRMEAIAAARRRGLLDDEGRWAA